MINKEDAIRRQLTLFLKKEESSIVEKIRQKFNPIQFELIKAHVTLCREDEIKNISKVLENLNSLDTKEFIIQFNKPTRFEDRKGVYLEAMETEDYHFLRKEILKGLISKPRLSMPHITLMHPRNSSCTDEIFNEIINEKTPQQFSFREISLIEQKNGGKWELVESFNLTK